MQVINSGKEIKIDTIQMNGETLRMSQALALMLILVGNLPNSGNVVSHLT